MKLDTLFPYPVTCRLTESRSAPLFHTMKYEKAMSMFDTDIMLARWKHIVPKMGAFMGNSFTRNRTLKWSGNTFLVLDQNALAQNNKMIPLDGEVVHAHTLGLGGTAPDRSFSEQIAEEFCVGDIKIVHRAIRMIHLKFGEPFLAGGEVIKLYNAAKKYGETWSIELKIDARFQEIVNDIIEHPELYQF